jgi:hypothetical protein
MILLIIFLNLFPGALFNQYPSVKPTETYNKIQVENDNSITGWTVYEQMPEFPGGQKEMMKFIKKTANIQY